MPRPCATCTSPYRADIDRALGSGLSANAVARQFDLNPASLHRHRKNCVGLKSAPVVRKEQSKASVALATLPSRAELGQAYGSLCGRIDEIVEQARAAGSLSIALQGLDALRRNLDSLSRIAGHDEAEQNDKFSVTINIGTDHEPITINTSASSRNLGGECDQALMGAE